MNPFHRLSIATLGLVIGLLVGPAFAAKTSLTVLLVNDIYLMGPTTTPDGRMRGGFARLASVVKAERASKRHVIVAHGGDTLSPSLMSGLDHGAHIIALTNLVQPDVFVPGNHEFDFGKAIFLQRMAEAQFPLYAANLRGADGAPLPGFRDRGIVTLDGVRIGITGATYDDSPRTSSPGDLRFLPTVPTVRDEVAALRREGADFVLAVLHAERMQALALMGPGGPDLILTGHTHDLYVQYDGRTALAEAGYDALYLVAIDLTIDVREEDGQRRTVWWPQFRIIDTAEVAPDAEVAAVVAGYEAELARELDVPLAKTAVELDSRTAIVRTREAAIGNLIADAMLQASGAEAAVMNGGGIRAARIYPPATALTRRDVLAELPFGNRLITLEIRGRDLRAALEVGVSRLPRPSGGFPQVAGLTLTVDPHRPPGARIVAIDIGGAPLDPDRLYRVATNDFLARGGDGYAAFAQARPVLPIEDSPLLANAVMVHLRRLGTVSATVEGRIHLR